MKIRNKQIQSFDEVRMPDFVDEMVGHLKAFTPLHSQSLGEDGVRHLIAVSIARAKRHEFTHRAAVRFYLETVILLGIDFDTDPQYPWAGEILRAHEVDQLERAQRVHAWLIPFLEHVGGPNRSYATRALHRAR